MIETQVIISEFLRGFCWRRVRPDLRLVEIDTADVIEAVADFFITCRRADARLETKILDHRHVDSFPVGLRKRAKDDNIRVIGLRSLCLRQKMAESEVGCFDLRVFERLGI